MAKYALSVSANNVPMWIPDLDLKGNFPLKYEGTGLCVLKPSVHTYPRTLFLPMSKGFKIEMKPVVNFDRFCPKINDLGGFGSTTLIWAQAFFAFPMLSYWWCPAF